MKKLLFSSLVVLMVLGMVGFLRLEWGLRTLLRAAEIISQHAFTIEKAEGNFLSAWKMNGLKLKTSKADISIGSLSYTWLPEKLMTGTLRIGGVTVHGAEVRFKAGKVEKSEKSDASPRLPATLLPYPLILESFDIHNLKIFDSTGELLTDIHRLRLKISGDRRHLEIHEGLIDATRYGLSIHGFINADSDWSTDVMGFWRITPTPEYAEMSGTFSARGPLDLLKVEAAADKPTDVRVSGSMYDLISQPHWQAHAEGARVWFPVFHQSWPDLTLIDATVDAAGDFSVYHGTVATKGSFLGFQHITGKSDVHGDGHGLSARSVQLRSPDGAVHVANLALDWWDAFSWYGEVHTDAFNPAGFDERFVGILTADLRSEGYLGYEDEDHLQTSTDIQFLEGTLRGFPVTGKGRVSSQASALKFEEIFLQSGLSFLQAAGSIADRYDLQFDLASPDIGEVLPGGEGEVSARGKVGGSREYPSLDLDLDVAGVHYAGNAIERLIGSIHADTKPGAEMSASLIGENVSWFGGRLHKGEISLAGSAEAHDLKARLQTDQGDLQFALHGGLNAMRWQGWLQDMQLAQPILGDWSQHDRADLAISSTEAGLSGLCLDREKSRICLNGDWRSQKDQALWQVAGVLRNFPLEIFSDNGVLPWPIKGLAEASLTATGDADRINTGDLKVSIPRAHIQPGRAEEGFERLSLMETSINLHLADQRLEADLQSALEDKSSIQLQIAIDKADAFDLPFWYQPIAGQLRLDMRDLTPIAPLSSFLLRPTGRLNSTLALSGSLSRPIFEGNLDLREGKIALPSLGIFLEDVGLNLTAVDEEVQITGRARSGPGQVEAEGILAYDGDSGVAGDFLISGDNFEVVRLPEYEIRIDPDVRFRFTAEKGELTGKLAVSHAILTPEEMKDSVSVSKDVIYTDQEVEEKVRRWPLESQVEVDLGDDVRLDGYGLKGKLRGKLAISDTSDAFMSGRGELSLHEGTFSLYGRSLAIERGRMVFSGGPVDNPAIDARALQLIKEKSLRDGNLTIGVDVSGTLQDLDFKLFSDPIKDDRDILAYMVVGHSMSDTNKEEGGILQAAAATIGLEEEAGLVTTLTGFLPVDEMHLEGTEKDKNMSLVVGKKLTDRLYIGYDHNFFDQKGSFRASYDLGLGFSVESKSSSDSNGADLFYSIER